MLNELFSNEFDLNVAEIALNRPKGELRELLEGCQLFFCGTEFFIDCPNQTVFKRLLDIHYEILRLFHRKDLVKTFCLHCLDRRLAFRCETNIDPDFCKSIKGKKLSEFDCVPSALKSSRKVRSARRRGRKI